LLTPARCNGQNWLVKANRRIPLAGALTAALLGVPACSHSESPPAVPSPAATAGARFGGTDLAWIEISIAMDEQVLPLLELVPAHTRNPDVRGLALRVQAFTDNELSTLRALRDQAGLPAQNPHEGMPMPGMVTPDQVSRVAALTGATFDAAVVEQLRAYLEQGRNLAGSEQESGVESQTRALASQAGRTRTKALSSIRG
jgi:hypothetical protein